MNKKPYFYKDEAGKVQKYIYCSLCLKGPFKKDQMNTDVFNFKSSIHYCLACAKINFREKLNEIITSSPTSQKKVEQTFEDVLLKLDAEPKTEEMVADVIRETQASHPDIEVDEDLVKEIANVFEDTISEKEEDILDRIDKEIKIKKTVKEPETKLVLEEKPIEEIKSEIGKTKIENLNNLPAKQIIEKVKTLTGIEITISLKNKQQIVKKAFNILNDHKIFQI